MKHWILCLVSVILITALVAPLPSSPAAAAPSKVGGPDAFGYTWNDALPYVWIDATKGQVASSEGDDESFGPIPLGFNFDFYENSYSSIYISVNGYISFVGEEHSSYSSKPFPRPTTPNNLIAPFWDDLMMGGGSHQSIEQTDYQISDDDFWTGSEQYSGQVYPKTSKKAPDASALENTGQIYYQNGVKDGVKYLVVEWKDVGWSGSPEDLLTFEAILYENGNICFQYESIQGIANEATVGIEDADGIDGLTYLSNQPGLKDLVGVSALCFTRPMDEERVKVLPAYASGFTLGGKVDFMTTVRNTGELGDDRYNFIPAVEGSPWTVSFYQADGRTPLKDTNGDQIVDTGPIGQGESLPVLVRLKTSPGAKAGDFSKVTLTIRSVRNGNKSTQTVLQGAWPSPFVQLYNDGLDGMLFKTVHGSFSRSSLLYTKYAGSTLAMVGTSDGFYISAWERNGYGEAIYTDIEYVLLDQYGDMIRPVTKLTDNADTEFYLTDHVPALSVLPSGQFGALWVRTQADKDGRRNSNVYLAIANRAGKVVSGPVNITNNEIWGAPGDMDIPYYFRPALTAMEDGNFFLAWTEVRTIEGEESSDVYFAIVDSQGKLIKPPTLFRKSEAGGLRYILPTLTSLKGGRVLLAYSLFDPKTSTYSLAYSVLDGHGDVVKGETPILGSSGANADGVQLSGGKIFLAWTNSATWQIGYAVLNESNYTIEQGPKHLTSPFSRSADYVSVVADRQNRAVLSWLDIEERDYMFYSLVDANGKELTPPMIFETSAAANPTLEVNQNGQGTAEYAPGNIHLPVIRKSK